MAITSLVLVFLILEGVTVKVFFSVDFFNFFGRKEYFFAVFLFLNISGRKERDLFC